MVSRPFLHLLHTHTCTHTRISAPIPKQAGSSLLSGHAEKCLEVALSPETDLPVRSSLQPSALIPTFQSLCSINMSPWRNPKSAGHQKLSGPHLVLGSTSWVSLDRTGKGQILPFPQSFPVCPLSIRPNSKSQGVHGGPAPSGSSLWPLCLPPIHGQSQMQLLLAPKCTPAGMPYLLLPCLPSSPR